MFTTIEEADFQQVVDIWNKGFSDYLLPINVDQKSLEQRIQSLKLSKKLSAVFSIEEEFAGIILLGIQTFKQTKVMWVGGMAVSPKHRRNKVATHLLDYAHNLARENQCEFLLLEVIATNERARKLYEIKGFQDVNELAVGTVSLPAMSKKKSDIYFKSITSKEQALNEDRWTPWQNRCIFSDKNNAIYQEEKKVGTISFTMVEENSSKTLLLKQLHLFEQKDVTLIQDILIALTEQENIDIIKLTNFDMTTAEYIELERIGILTQLTQFQLVKEIK